MRQTDKYEIKKALLRVRLPNSIVSLMVPTPTASIECPANPLIGWGRMGHIFLKSERIGDMWHEAPVSIIKGREDVGAEPAEMESAVELFEMARQTQNRKCYAPWTILLSHAILYLYSLTIYTTRPLLPDYDFLFWTYMSSRYLAVASCSLTFLIRIMFAWSRDLTAPLPWLPSILYPARISQFYYYTYKLFCCLLYIWLRICQHITALPCRFLLLTRLHTLRWLLP